MNTIIQATLLAPSSEREEHSHKMWEVIYSSCEGVIHTPMRDVTYHEGDFICIPPLCKHNRSLAGKHDVSMLINKAMLPFKEVTVIADKDGVLQFATDHVLATPQGDSMLSAWGNLLVSKLSHEHTLTYSPIVVALQKEMDKNVSSPFFSLEDFMRKLPLHYDYVRKLYKKETGFTPHDYLLSRRMQLAQALLTSGMTNTYSTYTVAQIAEMCGFSDPLYFSRVFKKYFGVSPTEALYKK